MKKKKFTNTNAKAGIWYIGGNLFDKAFVFMTIPVFTRLLDTYNYGIVNTYLSWVSIATLLIGMSLGSSIRNAYVDYKEDLNEFIASIILLSMISFLIFFIVIIIMMALFFENKNILLVSLCLIQGYMTFIITCVGQKYMMELKYKKNTILMSIPHVIIAILSIIIIVRLNQKEYLGRIIPNVIVTSIVGFGYIYTMFKKAKSISTKYWRYAITLSLPLILHGLSMNVLSQSDRIMITAFKGASEAGVYSLIYNLSMIAIVFSASFDSVWIPWFTKKMQSNNKLEINRVVSYYIELMLIIIIGLLFVSPEIIKVIAPKEYWAGIRLIPPIIMSSFVMYLYTIEVHIEYYYKATKDIAINTCVAAVVNLILNFVFIPRYGALAATFTTLIAYMVSFIMHYLSARKLDKELIAFKIYFAPISISVLASILAYILLDNMIARWIIICLVFVAYIIYAYKSKRFHKLFNNE